MVTQNLELLRRTVSGVRQTVIGYDYQTEMMTLALMAGGHTLAVGDPGTGKTMAAKTLAAAIGDAAFKRVQFVPDLMPGDLLGSEVWDPQTGVFRFVPGPINPTVNIFLSDEINRAAQRTQAAMLEVMEEGQISVPGYFARLHDVFMVVATRNPIESGGVYSLPEAQKDRFCVELNFPKPAPAGRLLILKQTAFKRHKISAASQAILTVQQVLEIRQEIADSVVCQDSAYEYVNRICCATDPEYCAAEHKGLFATSVSVRAGQWILLLAQAKAYLEGSSYISPDHIRFVTPAVLRHRYIFNDDGQADGVKADDVTEQILKSVKPE